MIEHTLNLGVYHWDTFDNETILVGEADERDEAMQIILDKYGIRLSSHGADRVQVVNKEGEVVEEFGVC